MTSIFTLRTGELHPRLDVQFYLPDHRALERRLHECAFPVFQVGGPEISVAVFEGPFGSDRKVSDYATTGVPLIRVSDCKTGEIDRNGLVFISDEKHQTIRRSEVLPGDVLLTKAGSLGYTAVFPDDLGRGNITSHLACIRPAPGVDPQYLAMFLRCELGRRQLFRWGNRSTRPEMNTTEVRQILVPLPSADEQGRLMRAVETALSRAHEMRVRAEELVGSTDQLVADRLALALPERTRNRIFTVPMGAVRAEGRLGAEFFNPERAAAVTLLKSAIGMSTQMLGHVTTIERELRRRPTGRYIGLASVKSNTGELLDEEEVVGGPCLEYGSSDVLFGRLRPNLNKVYVATGRGYCSTEFVILRIRQAELVPAYLGIALRSQFTLAQTVHMTTGNTHPRVMDEDLERVWIGIPSLEIQNELVEEVGSRLESAARLRESADELSEAASADFVKRLLTGV